MLDGDRDETAALNESTQISGAELGARHPVHGLDEAGDATTDRERSDHQRADAVAARVIRVVGQVAAFGAGEETRLSRSEDRTGNPTRLREPASSAGSSSAAVVAGCPGTGVMATREGLNMVYRRWRSLETGVSYERSWPSPATAVVEQYGQTIGGTRPPWWQPHIRALAL